MKAEYLNPFIKSVTRIIEETTSEKPAMGKVFLRDGYPYTTKDVAIFVGITGYLSGQLVISLPMECALSIAAAMLMEEKIFELDEFAQSAIAEMANMITANATIGLSDAGYKCDITPPSVITGTKMEVSSPPKIRTVVIPLKIGVGDIEVNISLIETAVLVSDAKEREFKATAVGV
jgi:chemotaxis protein CheX